MRREPMPAQGTAEGAVVIDDTDPMAAGAPLTDRYDVIYWNSNVIDAPPEFEYLDELQWAFFDRDYAAHSRFLAQGPKLLAPGGRMFLGFNTLGNKERLRVIADELGLELATCRRQ